MLYYWINISEVMWEMMFFLFILCILERLCGNFGLLMNGLKIGINYIYGVFIEFICN